MSYSDRHGCNGEECVKVVKQYYICVYVTLLEHVCVCTYTTYFYKCLVVAICCLLLPSVVYCCHVCCFHLFFVDILMCFLWQRFNRGVS